MKLLLENWRRYQDDLLIEGKILDTLKAGFKNLIVAPSKFDQMVQQTKQNFSDNIVGNIEEWAESPKMQDSAREIAEAIASYYEKNLQESTTKKTFTVDELRELGVGPETIELIRVSSGEIVAETLVSAAEEVVGKSAPPAIKDWLLRFVSKFIGSFVFGFIDNFIMVIAGSQIDTVIGGAIGGMIGSSINTGMLAAGLGNTLSDAIGELASNSIESVMKKVGLDPQKVTDEEVASGRLWMRFLDKQASVIGIILGCLVGLFPLFLFEEKETSHSRYARTIRSLEDKHAVKKEEFLINFNLFIDFVRDLEDDKNPELVDKIKRHTRGAKIEPKANQKMQQYMWFFPYDVLPELDYNDCAPRIEYLNKLVAEYWRNPTMRQVSLSEKETTTAKLDKTIYQRCRQQREQDKQTDRGHEVEMDKLGLKRY